LAGRLILLGLVVPCLLLSIPAVVAFRAQRELGESFRWVAHTIEVQRELETLESLLLEAESDQRGYLLSTHAHFLETHGAALGNIARQVALVRRLTADNPTQQENLALLAPLMAAKLDFMARTVALQMEGRREEMLALVETDRGKATMDAVRRRLDLMEAEEARLHAEREGHLATRAHSSTLLLSGLVVLNALFILAVFLLYRRLAKAQALVTICAWSRTVEHEGKWVSFEEYLRRRFSLDTSHGISPEEARKAFGEVPE
jgi:CHASE3 domain sensor protein